MKLISLIVAVLLVAATFIFGFAAIYGFFILNTSYLNAMLHILMMVVSAMVSMNLFVIAQEER